MSFLPAERPQAQRARRHRTRPVAAARDVACGRAAIRAVSSVSRRAGIPALGAEIETAGDVLAVMPSGLSRYGT